MKSEFTLQIFDHNSMRYRVIDTSEDPDQLMLISSGLPRRVVRTDRDKELPLVPRIPHRMSGKPRKYAPATMIEPANVETLADRAARLYAKRANAGERNIPVYVWTGSKFADRIEYKLRERKLLAVCEIIPLDPDEYL